MLNNILFNQQQRHRSYFKPVVIRTKNCLREKKNKQFVQMRMNVGACENEVVLQQENDTELRAKSFGQVSRLSVFWGTKGQALKKLDSCVAMETAQQQVGGIFTTEIQMRNVPHSYFWLSLFFRGETHTKRMYSSY